LEIREAGKNREDYIIPRRREGTQKGVKPHEKKYRKMPERTGSRKTIKSVERVLGVD